MKVDSSIIGFVVANLRIKYGIKNFVETGSAQGETTELAAIAFDRVFSCEIDRTLFAQARDRLISYPHAQVFWLPSVEFLKLIKPQIADQPTMYWLDGHWCGGPVKPSKECPLLEELAEIGSLNDRSVILIDDVGYMIKPPPRPHDPNQWPTITAVQNALASWNVQTTIEQGPLSKVMVVVPGEQP